MKILFMVLILLISGCATVEEKVCVSKYDHIQGACKVVYKA